ncbi:MAG: hypothetical protein WC341_09915 [Bacteroidales bacterium]|jgi:hypothetical protein
MSDSTKNVILWLIAVIITVSLVIYQRATGPTYPVKGKVEMNGEIIKYKLIRSFMGEQDALVEIEVPDNVTGEIEYKRFKSYDKWSTVPMTLSDGKLVGVLPNQPPAGKISYFVRLFYNGKAYPLNSDPVVIRFTGDVPLFILAPHIFFMFLSVLFGIRMGLELFLRKKDTLYFTGVVVITLFMGGLVLGPIVQKYAFDAYWTGWPFGHDLTDNKTIGSFILWIIAWFVLRKNKENKVWPILALIGMMAVYLIPHSALGSEIDHTKTQTPPTEQNK